MEFSFVLSTLAIAFSVTFLWVFGRRIVYVVHLANKIPGPTLWELLTQHSKHLLGDSMHTYITSLCEKFQYKIWGVWFYTTYIITVSDCETMGEIFANRALTDKPGLFYDSLASFIGNDILTMNGPAHRRNRKEINRAFQKSTLQLHQERINVEVLRFVELIRGVATEEKVDVRPYVEDLISATVTSTYSSGTIPYNKARSTFRMIKHATKVIQLRSANPFYYWSLYQLKPSSRALSSDIKKSLANMKKVFLQAKQVTSQNMLDNSRAKPQNVLELLATHPPDRFEEEGWSETRAIFGAGSDTTIFVLNVTLVLLAMHPEIQEQLFQEAEAIFGKSDRGVEAQDLSLMVLMEMVIKESLRLFPPAPFILKRVPRELNLSGYVLPSETNILVNIMALHRNPRSFKDPLEFDPGRFSPERSEGRHPCAFIPFSLGPRNCPGQLLAMMVLKTALCCIIRNFRISLAEKLNSVEDIKTEMHFTAHLCESPLCFIGRRTTTSEC